MAMPPLFALYNAPGANHVQSERVDDHTDAAAFWSSVTAASAEDQPSAPMPTAIVAAAESVPKPAVPGSLPVLQGAGSSNALRHGPGLAVTPRGSTTGGGRQVSVAASEPLRGDHDDLRQRAISLAPSGEGKSDESTPSEKLRDKEPSVIAGRVAVAALGDAMQWVIPTGAALTRPDPATMRRSPGDGATDAPIFARDRQIPSALRTSGAGGIPSLRPTGHEAADTHMRPMAGAVAMANASSVAVAPAIAGSPVTTTAVPPADTPFNADVAALGAMSASAMSGCSDPVLSTIEPTVAFGLDSTPVGSEAWPDQLGAQLWVMAAQGGETEAVIKLAPEGIGDLVIRVLVRDGDASLQFGAADAQTRQAIESAQPRLRELFASQGIVVSAFNVFSDLSGNPHPSNGQDEHVAQSAHVENSTRDDIKARVIGREPRGIVDLYA